MFILEEKFCGLSRHHSQEGQQETQSMGADCRYGGPQAVIDHRGKIQHLSRENKIWLKRSTKVSCQYQLFKLRAIVLLFIIVAYHFQVFYRANMCVKHLIDIYTVNYWRM